MRKNFLLILLCLFITTSIAGACTVNDNTAGSDSSSEQQSSVQEPESSSSQEPEEPDSSSSSQEPEEPDSSSSSQEPEEPDSSSSSQEPEVPVNPLSIPDFIVEVEEGKDPVVLQLTDTQLIDAAQQRSPDRLGGSALEAIWATDNMDELCYDYLTEVITVVNPDLIILTGDIIYGEFDDNGTVLEGFVSFMESFEIPWAPVFGNHDNESAKGVDWQCEQFENATYCLFEQKTLTGNGNYSVGIAQGGALKRVFYMLDSNGCGGASAASLSNGHTKTSAGFGQDQIDWYTSEIQELKELSPETKFSFAYHIQQYIFKDAYAQYGFKNEGTLDSPINIDYYYGKSETDFGYLGRNLKGPWDTDYTVYNGMKALGADSIFVGHEHCNSASVVYEGIRFQFGQKSSEYDRFNWVDSTGKITGSYGNTCTGTPIIGGTVIPLSESDGSIKNPYIYLCEDAGGSIDWEQWNIDVAGLEEVSLNTSLNYAKTTWDAANGAWVNNTNDFVASGLTVLENKKIDSVYLVEKSTDIATRLDGSVSGSTLSVSKDQLKDGDFTLKIIAEGKKYYADFSVATAVITTVDEFKAMRAKTDKTVDDYYVLGNDIDFENKGVSGSATFKGTFDGKGYAIKNFQIAWVSTYDSGLFGSVVTGSSTKYTTLKNFSMINVTGGSDKSGAIANEIKWYTNVENVFIDANLTRGSSAAGSTNYAAMSGIMCSNATSYVYFRNCVVVDRAPDTILRSGGLGVFVGYGLSAQPQFYNCYGVSVANRPLVHSYNETNYANTGVTLEDGFKDGMPTTAFADTDALKAYWEENTSAATKLEMLTQTTDGVYWGNSKIFE